ncbi:MAG: DUF6263 family protein [Planctomycetaceae bacterium]
MPIRALVLLSVFTVSTANLQAQGVQLRWKFRSQESLNYTVLQNMETVMVVGDNEVKQAMNQSMDMTWNIKSVAAGGDTVMDQVVSRIQMKMAGGPAGDVQFDTSNPQKSENPIINSMGEVFRKIVNQAFTIHMKPTGEIGEVQVPQELIEAIKNSAAGSSNALNEDTLKQMMKQSAVTLPAGPVKAGDTWNSRQSVQLPFGTMEIQSQMTLTEVDASGNAIINIKPEISVAPREGAPVKMSLNNSTGSGVVTFHVESGRVTRSQLLLDMEMKIEAGQQTFTQNIRQSTEMKLAQ